MSHPTFEPELDIKQIRPHPANPRRKAAADPEMVDSIKAQGLLQHLVVAPSADGDGYVVLAGHRRLDGCKKARLKTVPAMVRTDVTTDAQQIEIAVVENVHREGLTPIEEAEAFAQLRDLKWTQSKIAQKTGRPVATVRDRLKLLKLSKKTIDSVHKGQLTLGDALDLVSFSDDPKVQAKLTKAAGTSNFRYELQRAKDRRKTQREIDATAAVLLERGAVEVDAGGVAESWGFMREHAGTYTRIASASTYSPEQLDADLEGHDTCAGFVRFPGDTWSGPSLLLVCTDPASHGGEAAEQAASDAEAAAERERAIAESRAHDEALKTAATLRRTTVMERAAMGGVTGPAADLVRALLPPLVWDLEGQRLERYCTALGIDDPWDTFAYRRDDDDREKFRAHVDDISIASGTYLASVLVALLLQRTETQLPNASPSAYPAAAFESMFAGRYFELLEGLGHDLCDVDLELRAQAAGDDEAVSA